MAAGLNANLITFTPGTTARSADVNSNYSALNNDGSYAFDTCQIDTSLTPDNTFRGMKMLTSTDFGILNNTSANWLRLTSGLTQTSKVAICDLSNNLVMGIWSDGTYDYIDCGDSYFRVKTGAGNTPSGGNNTLRAAGSNAFNVGGTNYGFVTAGNGAFNQGTGNADIAEPLLTTDGVQPGMAVCCSSSDTVSPCTHDACKVAKIVSTAPTLILTPRVENDEDFTPIKGHESAMPIVIGGIAPVLMVEPANVKLRDRITPSGTSGLCRVAADDEYALGDVVKIENGTIYAWIHY